MLQIVDGVLGLSQVPRSSISSMIQDTHNTASFGQQHRRCRNTASGRSFAGESSETLTNSFLEHLFHRESQTLTALNLSRNSIGPVGAQHLGEALGVNQVRQLTSSFSKFYLTDDHRHSQHCILCATALVLKEHSIWATLCESTKWDTQHRASQSSISMRIADTHDTGSFEHWHRCCRSSVSGRSVACESSEMLTTKIVEALFHRWSKTLTTLGFWWNSIGAERVQHLAVA